VKNQLLFVKGILPEEKKFLDEVHGIGLPQRRDILKQLVRKEQKDLHRLFRQRSLQYFTSSHTRAHFFRQVKGRRQLAQIFWGRCCLFAEGGIVAVFIFTANIHGREEVNGVGSPKAGYFPLIPYFLLHPSGMVFGAVQPEIFPWSLSEFYPFNS
jgi:hypothetical protein